MHCRVGQGPGRTGNAWGQGCLVAGRKGGTPGLELLGWIIYQKYMSAKRGLRHWVELGGFLNTSLTKFSTANHAARVDLPYKPSGRIRKRGMAWGEKWFDDELAKCLQANEPLRFSY